ncbi:FAD-dependent oxidoreductase [Haloferula sargassicola]|uniref:enoyl-CoA hydratase n=1 Tax=Haloferula sargassicola TaxID=490096 RepID=A0ABP9UQT0_9BACT
MNISLTSTHGIATLLFDREGSSANIFDRATLEELSTQLEQIAADNSLKGLLLRSAKPSIFIAGADLKTLSSASGDELASLIDLGHRVFNQLEKLRIPTVAAIHGACVGGGYELALACDWRVASDSSKTRIGLPETKLGILPAWGGSTRLPRLVGLPAALPLVLGGKLLKPEAARRKGLVDAVVPREHLESHSLGYLKNGKRSEPSHFLAHNPVSVAVIRKKAGDDLEDKTRGLYPAQPAALDVMCRAVSGSKDASFSREKEAILDLARRPETASLMRLFQLTERAKKHRYTEAEPREIQRTAVIGAGVMGAGIAYWLSTRGIDVVLRDISEKAVAAGMARISKNYDTSRRKHILSATEAARGLDRIHATARPVPLHRCQLVIEAASEELEIKKTIFADLSQRTAHDTLLATNTSALPIRELAGSIENPWRLLGLHFFNPVHRMQLVEVVRTDQTSDEAIATAIAFVRRIGKMPVLVKDSPGFLVNRILLPYLVEAAEIFEKGGNPKVIDDAMLDFGMPMGPLRLLDEVGLDVAAHVAHTLAAAFPDRMRVPAIAEKLVEAGHLGRKSGKGFYRYGKNGHEPSPKALSLRTGSEPAPRDLQSRLAGLMADEARRCLDEGIAESADDIDLAMVLGTGFAPFRGGPMQI